jgi:hypothetical protein
MSFLSFLLFLTVRFVVFIIERELSRLVSPPADDSDPADPRARAHVKSLVVQLMESRRWSATTESCGPDSRDRLDKIDLRGKRRSLRFLVRAWRLIKLASWVALLWAVWKYPPRNLSLYLAMLLFSVVVAVIATFYDRARRRDRQTRLKPSPLFFWFFGL